MTKVFWMKQRMYQIKPDQAKQSFLSNWCTDFHLCHITKKSSRKELYLAHGMIFREMGISRVTGKFSITFWKSSWTQFFSVSASSDTTETSQPALHFSLSTWYSDVTHWTNCIIGSPVAICCLKINIEILLYQQDKVIWLPGSIMALLKNLPFQILFFCLPTVFYLLLLNSWLFFPGIPLKVTYFSLFLFMFCSFSH